MTKSRITFCIFSVKWHEDVEHILELPQIRFKWLYFRTQSRKLDYFIDLRYFCHNLLCSLPRPSRPAPGSAAELDNTPSYTCTKPSSPSPPSPCSSPSNLASRRPVHQLQYWQVHQCLPSSEPKGFTCPILVLDVWDGFLDSETLQPLDFSLPVTLIKMAPDHSHLVLLQPSLPSQPHLMTAGLWIWLCSQLSSSLRILSLHDHTGPRDGKDSVHADDWQMCIFRLTDNSDSNTGDMANPPCPKWELGSSPRNAFPLDCPVHMAPAFLWLFIAEIQKPSLVLQDSLHSPHNLTLSFHNTYKFYSKIYR